MRFPRLIPVWATAIAVGVAACGLRPPASGNVQDSAMPLACRPIDAVIPGAEDIAIDHHNRVAYVSSTDRRAWLNGDKPTLPDGRVGHVFRIDLTTTPARVDDVTPATNDVAQPFRPHGVGLLPRTDGSAVLFVINHTDKDAGASTIERLELPANPAGAAPLRGLGRIGPSRELVSPNDVAPVDETRFYVTNEHGVGPGLEQTLRDLFGFNNGNLLFFDGNDFQSVADPLPWANGVALRGATSGPGDRDGQLFVASTSGGTISTFAWRDGRHPATPASDAPIALGGGPDNIDVDPHGTVFVAVHPDLLRFAFYGKRWFGVTTAPSSIVRIDNAGTTRAKATRIYRADGVETNPNEIAAASVGAAYADGKKLLLGGVFTNRVLQCDLP